MNIGLGTSTAAEAREYFSAFDRHTRELRWVSDEDDDLLDVAFEKERVEVCLQSQKFRTEKWKLIALSFVALQDRRRWINEAYDEKTSVYYDQESNDSIRYKDFVNKELVHFSHGDNIRSIPSAMDGLKPSQRKVLFACFKRNLKSEMKVAQLSGYCAEHTAYHHGKYSKC